MKELALRKLHRIVGVVIAPLLILQAQAGVYANYVGRLAEATTKVDSFMLRKE